MITLLEYAGAIVLWFLYNQVGGFVWYRPDSVLAFLVLTGVVTFGLVDFIIDRIIPPDTRYNINDWRFFPETGRHLQILLRNQHTCVFNNSSYEDRMMQRHILKDDLFFARTLTAIMYVFSFFFFWEFDSSLPPVNYLLGYWFLFMYAGGVMSNMLGQLEIEATPLGPPPVAPAGREAVNNENIYGIGGFGDLYELDSAARGDASRASSRLPIFDD